MRISDWISYLCSSDLLPHAIGAPFGTPINRWEMNHANHNHVQEPGAVPQGKPSASGGGSIPCVRRACWSGFRRHRHDRSDERSVGKECVSKCRSRRSLYDSTTKQNNLNMQLLC